VERRTALDLIGSIGGSSLRDPAELSALVKFLKKLEKNDAVPAGPRWVALGRVCANPAVEPSLAAHVFAEFRTALKKKKSGFDLVLALGYLAASPATSAKDACDVALDILQTLEGKLPEPHLGQEQTDEGVRLVISDEALAYTEFIPNLLSAVTMIYSSGKLPATVRGKVVDRLIRRWDDLIEFREIWAPGTVIDLARCFCTLARHPSTAPEERHRLIDAILRYCRNTTICRILADGLAGIEDDSDEQADLVGRFVDNLQDLFRHPDYQQADDRRAIVLALGKTAMNRRLSRSKKESERRREQIVELLIEQSGPTQRDVSRLLRELGRSPHVSAALKSRLQSVNEG
jgi:hypothetical protein